MVASNEPMYDSINKIIKSLSVCLLGHQGYLMQFGIEWQTLHILQTGYKKPIVAILYQLCYGLSQKCNWFECDHAVVLNDCHLNQ